MTLSVIIPVYKAEDTIAKCLESVVTQGYPEMEVILVDDGGTDKCPEMCDNLARLYNHESARHKGVKVIVIHSTHLGLSSARNSGLDIASGDYITFVDSDDFIGPGTYVKIMNYLSLHPDIDIAEYGVAERYNNPTQRKVLALPDKIYYNEYEYWFETEAYKHTYAWNKFYRRSLFDIIRYPTGKSFEDAIILPKLLNKSKKIATMSIGTYYYSCHDDGTTITTTDQELTQQLLSGVRSLAWIPKKYRKGDWYVKLYASVLNTQVTLYIRTKGRLSLPHYRFKLRHIYKARQTGMSRDMFVKMLIMRYTNLKWLCETWRILTKIRNLF